MARPLARALAGSAAAAVLAAPIMLAAPAQAAEDTPTPTYAGAASALALRLQINLPAALAPLAVDLQVDPVTGTVTVDGKGTASGQVLGSDRGILKTALDALTPLKGISTATQADAGPNTSSPVPALPAPLSSILSLGLIESSAQVTKTSSASSASVARLGLALGDTLQEAAGPLIDGLDTLQNTLITTIANAVPGLTTPLCAPVTTIADTVLAPLGLNNVVISTVCDLDELLVDVSGDVSQALQTLGDNIFNIGLIQTTQSIKPDASGALVSKATASIAGLGLLGTGPLGSAGVIQSSATATANGVKGGAKATAVPPVVLDLNVGGLPGLTTLQTTLTGIIGDIGGGTLTGPLTTIVQQLLDTVNSLTQPLGATVVALDDSNSATSLESCPTSLTGMQKGSFAAADGTCAAAATRGIGIEVTLPTVLATPLGITGPFISLALAPSAAVAQAAVAPVVTPPVVTTEEPGQSIDRLPRTGVESGVAGAAALAALGGAAYLRRRSLATR